MTTTNKNGSQQLKKYAVFALMFIGCAVAMWFIFAPSDTDKAKAQQGVGLNSELPDPKRDGIISDKRDAYQQEMLRQKQEQNMRSLQDYDFFAEDENSTQSDYNDERHIRMAPVPIDFQQPRASQSSSDGSGNSVHSSTSAYRDLNRTLGSFYEPVKEDEEKQELERKVEELQARLDEGDSHQASIDEQVLLMEKSYELAARYLPKGEQNPPFANQQPVTAVDPKAVCSNMNNGKTNVAAVEPVSEQIVSALPQEVSDGEFVKQYSRERNMGFHTPSQEVASVNRNTLGAVVHETQTITDAQAVRLRLTEAIRVDDMVVPVNTIVTGMSKITGERLEITVTSIEYEGRIVRVKLFAYDSDGQRGISIPASMEQSAIKEIAANMGGNLGTTINLNQQGAGEQLLTDLGRGAIQGTSQYLSKKLRQVKVTLKAGYALVLLPNEQ